MNDFAQQVLDSIAGSLGVSYEMLSTDYAKAATAADIAWQRECDKAYRGYLAEMVAFKQRWDGAVNRMIGVWCADYRLDQAGVQQGLRP